MKDNFKILYKKENITDIEQQLIDRLLETDFNTVNGNKKDMQNENLTIESLLRAYANDEFVYIFCIYSTGDKSGAACVTLPIDSFKFDFNNIPKTPDGLHEIVFLDEE